MKTGSFKTYAGPGRISIARYARGTAGGFRIYSNLAPGPWFKTATKEEYTRLFFEQLGRLDPRGVVDTLQALAGDHEPILMCWEVPPFTESNWCHRRMVAEWLGDKIGLDVPELEIEPDALAKTREFIPAKPKVKVVTPQQVLAFGTVGLEVHRDGKWQDLLAPGSASPLIYASRKFAEAAIAELPESMRPVVRVKP